MQTRRFDIIGQFVCIVLLLSGAQEGAARNINWSGYNWWVRTSGGAPQGPGPNIFSDSLETVFIDENGDLHLRIHQEAGKWVGAEINNHISLGYGTYEWEVSSRYDLFANNVVGGLFTYINPASVGNAPHEIDIEFTKAWGSANLYHTTHDPDIQAPSWNFQQALTGDFTTHRFTWRPDSITWGSYNGHVAGVDDPPFPIVEQRAGPNFGAPAVHTYTGPVVPQDGNEIPIINFWMSGNNVSNLGPSDGQMQEMIIHSFTYTPLPEEPSADFDGNGHVDGVDFLIWQQGAGIGTSHSQGDANYSGTVDAADLGIWESQYGTGNTAQAALQIPEPPTSSILFGALGVLCFAARLF